MPGGRLPNYPSSGSKGFSSTPLKTSQQGHNTSKVLDAGALSEDEDTFSLLSPIYHDSFDSDEESSPTQLTSARQMDNSRVTVSPIRCELPKTPSEQMLNATTAPAGSPTLSPWEMWLLNKSKEGRLKSEKKAEEELIRKENIDQQEREHKQKQIAVEKSIQEWLKMKKQQEKQKQLVKQSKKEEEKQKQQDRQKETEHKAQQKYKSWVQKKNQERIEVEKKEKEESALKAEQEEERRQRAEMRFQEWLKANEKNRPSPNSSFHPKSPYDRFCPSPSFYNPIPWKPIPIPPPQKDFNKTSDKKPQIQRRCRRSPGTTFRLKNFASAGQLVQRR
ncbi:coiled-coil domain-containing protein 34-like [Brachionichthys hirsutus]|uniref:coiled-coil domain-containing protein 34-like n=1 Tax=Brachionichthys hirsutus TaxID=412623 RepID=UPI003604D616